MNTFKVWISRLDGSTFLRVDGLDNTNWLLRRLSDSFVFKTSEPLRDVSSSAYSFRVADNSRLSGLQFEKLLSGISEVRLILEASPPLAN
jgi:hypothetical protein